MSGNNKKNISEEGLATELLHEIKVKTKRWTIAFIAVLILWAGTAGTFVWFLYQYNI